jgi:nucleoid-associated protein YgaU
MGIFDKKDEPKADFSDVKSGSSSTARPPETGAGRSYVVVKGDSLSKIAQREYGDAKQWTRIFEANRDTITDANLIYPGQTIRLP